MQLVSPLNKHVLLQSVIAQLLKFSGGCLTQDPFQNLVNAHRLSVAYGNHLCTQNASQELQITACLLDRLQHAYRQDVYTEKTVKMQTVHSLICAHTPIPHWILDKQPVIMFQLQSCGLFCKWNSPMRCPNKSRRLFSHTKEERNGLPTFLQLSPNKQSFFHAMSEQL